MIDIEKFICSLLADHPEGVAVRGDIHRALKEQGLEYKDGKIVPIEDKNPLLSDFFKAEYDRGYYDALKWVYENTYGDNYKLSVKDKMREFIKE